MNKIEFDSDGRPVLPDSVKEDLEKEKDSLILTKIQVSVRNSAIAQLKIEFGKKVQDSQNKLYELKGYIEGFIQEKYSSVENKVIRKDGFLIVEARASWLMYSFFKDLVEALKFHLKKMPTVVKGKWDNGDNFLQK